MVSNPIIKEEKMKVEIELDEQVLQDEANSHVRMAVNEFVGRNVANRISELIGKQLIAIVQKEVKKAMKSKVKKTDCYGKVVSNNNLEEVIRKMIVEESSKGMKMEIGTGYSKKELGVFLREETEKYIRDTLRNELAKITNEFKSKGDAELRNKIVEAITKAQEEVLKGY